MKSIKLTKDQIQKLALSAMGFAVLLYVYFSFFLVVSALLQELFGVRQQGLRVALAQRPVHVPGLTKAAALDASPHHLERDAVVHDVHRRHELTTEQRQEILELNSAKEKLERLLGQFRR